MLYMFCILQTVSMSSARFCSRGRNSRCRFRPMRMVWMTRKIADWTMTAAGRGVSPCAQLRCHLQRAHRHFLIFQHLNTPTTSLNLMSCHNSLTPLRFTAVRHCLPPEAPQSYRVIHAFPALNPPRPEATHRKHHFPLDRK